jgi:hypothetical protein
MKEKKIVFEKLTVEEKERIVGGIDNPQPGQECQGEDPAWKPAYNCG